MKKKITRIIIFSVFLLIALLIALPYLLEDKVGKMLKENVNSSINGEFDFDEFSLSLYREFPNARLKLKGISLVNIEPFAGDTLYKSSEIELSVGIGELLGGSDEPIEIDELLIREADIQIKIKESGFANYDIAITSSEMADADEQESATRLRVKAYEISDSRITYDDAETNLLLEIENFNHSGNGDVSQETSVLDTRTEALVSFIMEDSRYLDKNKLELDALLEIDLVENRYTFKENRAVINRLPISFDGWLQLNDDDQLMDFSFKTISSDFKNFLALIPEKYSKDISNLQTKGNFDINGHVEGLLSEETIPGFRIALAASDASFKYPDLPRKVENINIDAVVENTSGIAEETAIRIENASFQIGRDAFEIRALISDLQGNTGIDSHAKGSINLNNLAEAYPVSDDLGLSGIFKGDIHSTFNLADIENENYKNIDLAGEVDIKGLNYAFESLPSPLKVHHLSASLGPKVIEINEIAGVTGTTDFSATGKLRNTLGFLFNEEVLRGQFEMRSNSFVIADLMQEEEQEEVQDANDEEPFKVPAFVDISLEAMVGKAIYDKIIMYDLVGNLRIKDEQITFSEISSRMLDGRIAFSGNVSTQGQKPEFNMAMDMTKLNIAKTFENIDLMQVLGPAAKSLEGRFNTNISLAGNLTEQLDLDLNSLSGNLFAEILTARVKPDGTPVTQLVNNRMSFLSLDKLDLAGLKTAVSFEDGQVKIKPVKLKYEDIGIEISGGHSFASMLNYNLTFDVPAKYMGEDVNRLLASIGDESLEDVSVPVVANIGGSYSQPKIKTDMKAQAKALTNELVDIQKEKYINKGKKEVNQLLNNVLASESEKKDNTEGAVSATEAVSEMLGKPDSDEEDQSTDSTNSSDEVLKEKAKSILGGLLKSKSKAVTAKDTLNR